MQNIFSYYFTCDNTFSCIQNEVSDLYLASLRQEEECYKDVLLKQDKNCSSMISEGNL